MHAWEGRKGCGLHVMPPVLLRRAGGSTGDQALPPAPDPKDTVLVSHGSPFLAWLAAHCAAAGALAQNDLQTGQAEDLESALRQRLSATSARAAAVAEDVERLRRASVRAADGEAVAMEPSTAAPDSEAHARAPAAASSPQTDTAELPEALATLLRAENGRLRDSVLKAEVQLQQALTSLADREAELQVARRKLEQERGGQGAVDRVASGLLKLQESDAGEADGALRAERDALAAQLEEREGALKQTNR